MIYAFIATVGLFFGSANLGFEQGQYNPEAESLLQSKSKPAVEDDRVYGVDVVGN